MMNINVKLLFLLIIFSLGSCTQNSSFKEDSSKELSEITIRSAEDCFEIDYGAFANQMQWISYLCAQVVLRNTAGKQQFLAVLQGGRSGKIIPLEDLLGSTLFVHDFRNEFEEEFNFYHQTSCNDGGRPNGTPRPPGSPNQSSDPIDVELFEVYIEALLNENDFEFYLPNGFDETEFDEVLSSIVYIVSPVLGFRHYERCDVDSECIEPLALGNLIILR